MRWKFAALMAAVFVTGCQQANPTTEREIADLKARVSTLEKQQQVKAELPKPIVQDRFELIGLPGIRRFYENNSRCMDALKAISRAEDE